MDLVNAVIAEMNPLGALFAIARPVVTVHSKRFLGNIASSMSRNVERIRSTVSGNPSGALKRQCKRANCVQYFKKSVSSVLYTHARQGPCEDLHIP